MSAFYRCPTCNLVTPPAFWDFDTATCLPCAAIARLMPATDATVEHYRTWLTAHPKTAAERRDACSYVAAVIATQDLTEEEYAILAVALAPLIGVVVSAPEKFPALASYLPR